ncbi:enoyl-CoA hydratase/isomerase family protein [Chloroflexota bacterium]
MENNDVIFKRENGVATITLNRPDKRNALIPGIRDGLLESLEIAGNDDDIKVIVLTGTGKAFCSGGDVKALAENAKNRETEEPQQPPPRAPRLHLALLLQQCEKPIIAAVNGMAIGFGCDMALACDIRIASESATFSEAYIRRGIAPSGGGAYFLPRLVGIDKACQLIFTGEIIDAEEAGRIGMVTKVVPDDELESATLEIAENIAKMPLLALKASKKAIYHGLETDLKTSMEYVAAVRLELLKSEDHKEGTVSFVEKRAPQFKDK